MPAAPTGATESSGCAVITGVFEASSSGASLMPVTASDAVSVAALNALAPPLALASAVSPATPLLRSHARNVIAAPSVPFQSGFASKYSRVSASAASSRAAVSDTAPSCRQVAPPSSVYHHRPWAVSAPITAMPVDAPGSASPTLSSPPGVALASASADTGVPAAPAGEPRSSGCAVITGVFEASSTGASLTAVTASDAVSLSAENPARLPAPASARSPATPLLRSHARNVIAAPSVPLQSACAWKYSLVPASAASSRAAVSDTAPSCRQLAPPSSVYHHCPWAVSAAVTAIPTCAPGDGSTTLSRPPGSESESTSADTSVPTAPTGASPPSSMGASAGLAVSTRIGVSSSRLTSATVRSASDA